MRLFEWFSKQILYSAVESSFEVFWDVESLILCSCALATQVFFSWWALTLFIRTENGATDPYQNKTEKNIRRPCGTLFKGRAFLQIRFFELRGRSHPQCSSSGQAWHYFTPFLGPHLSSSRSLSFELKAPFYRRQKTFAFCARHQKCRRPDKEKTSKS